MINEEMEILAKNLDSKLVLTRDGWGEMITAEAKLLFYTSEEFFCLVLVYKLSSQAVLRKIFRAVRELGFESPAFTSGNYWRHTGISDYVFFRHNGRGRDLQWQTDKIMAGLADRVDELTASW